MPPRGRGGAPPIQRRKPIVVLVDPVRLAFRVVPGSGTLTDTTTLNAIFRLVAFRLAANFLMIIARLATPRGTWFFYTGISYLVLYRTFAVPSARFRGALLRTFAPTSSPTNELLTAVGGEESLPVDYDIVNSLSSPCRRSMARGIRPSFFAFAIALSIAHLDLPVQASMRLCPGNAKPHFSWAWSIRHAMSDTTAPSSSGMEERLSSCLILLAWCGIGRDPVPLRHIFELVAVPLLILH